MKKIKLAHQMETSVIQANLQVSNSKVSLTFGTGR